MTMQIPLKHLGIQSVSQRRQLFMEILLLSYVLRVHGVYVI